MVAGPGSAPHWRHSAGDTRPTRRRHHPRPVCAGQGTSFLYPLHYVMRVVVVPSVKNHLLSLLSISSVWAGVVVYPLLIRNGNNSFQYFWLCISLCPWVHEHLKAVSVYCSLCAVAVFTLCTSHTALWIWYGGLYTGTFFLAYMVVKRMRFGYILSLHIRLI